MDEDLKASVRPLLGDYYFVAGLVQVVQHEIISKAEAREILGLPPVDEGNRRYLTSMTYLTLPCSLATTPESGLCASTL